MRNLFAILLGFSAYFSQASHLAGGELTYTYISGKTYDINVTLYRDCNDCKLAGTGGGTSTTNCTDLEEVFIRTLNSSCGNKTIGSISLSKIGYENITPLCNSARSKCETNPSYPYGFEAHYYRGRVNFNDYTLYNGCMFQIFFHKSERSEGITNLTSEEDDLYNFALINPWIENVSSPVFAEAPKLLYNLYQPTYGNDGVISNTGDSLSFKWGTPFSNYNSAISYKSGYNSNQFVTTYCTAGGNCTANPVAQIPEGLFLNSSTGDFVFTPVGNNEVSTRVIEVEQWREVNGSYTLSGKIRRDVLVIISESNENNPPKITTEEVYNICVGQKFELELDITDLPVTNNGIQKQDSVQVSISSNIATLNVSTSSQSSPPYLRTRLNYEPKNGEEGIHFIQIKASDNYCPEIASAYKTIKVVVHEKPDFSFSIDDEFCGNNKVLLQQNRSGSVNINIKDEDSNVLFNESGNNSSFRFQYDKKVELNYFIEFTDIYGCTVTKTTTMSNLGNSIVEKAKINGNKSTCDNDKLRLELTHSNLEIDSVLWQADNNIISQTTNIDTEPFSGDVKINYLLKKNDLSCKMQDTITVERLLSTPIIIDEPKPLCFVASFNLENLKPSPANGSWSSTLPLNNSTISLTAIGNNDASFRANYSFVNNFGCTSSKEIVVPILAAPMLQLSNEVICGSDFEFRLKNTIELPYNPDVENITWRVINKPEAFIASPFPAINLPVYGAGIYSVEAINSFINGCITKDTSIITVDEGLSLSTNGKTTICQMSEAVNLESYLELNAEGGGWNSFTTGDLLETKMFTPSKCGIYDFKYTYDKNGCFDEINLNLEVICKPEFDINLPLQICRDYNELKLSLEGTWEGRGVENNNFYPNDIFGWVHLRNLKEVNGCLFDTFISIEVIDPLFLNIGIVPTSLCQNEELEFEINTSDINLLDIEACGNKFSTTNNRLHYIADNCDLEKREIGLRLTQKTTAMCTEVSKTIKVPYYPLPKAILPESSKRCWPFTISEKIQTEENLENISFQITSSSSNYRQSGREINYTFPRYGNYNLVVNTTSQEGCSNTQLFENQYILFPKPKAEFVAGNKSELTLSERDIYFGNKSTITQGTLQYQWSWTKNNKTEYFSNQPNPFYQFPADTGMFEIQLISISDQGCKDTTSQNIWIVPDILVFIPNAFTPDQKGPPENARFKIVCNNVEDFHMQIFNKWGQQVFEAFDINNSWDGNFGGKICQTGIYVYVIKIKNQSGLEYQYQGTVNLIR